MQYLFKRKNKASISKAAEVQKPDGNEPVDLSSNFNNDNIGNNTDRFSATVNEESTVKPPAVVEKEVTPKPTQEASKAVELPDETIEVVTSEEEWEGTTYYKIGHHLVKDVRFDKDSLAIGAKLPFKIVKESRRFTATSLNNKITFIATNTQAKSSHNPEKGSSVCGLTPVCTRRWVQDEPIASVFIFDSNWHPKNEKEQWVCGHHHEASIRGNNLQIQKLCKAASKTTSKTTPTKKASPADPFKELDNFKKGRKVSAESEAGKEGAVKDTKEVQK